MDMFEDVKPDCYCLGGDKAHYNETKYRAVVKKANNLIGENLLLADILRDAYEVIKTIEGEDSDECDKLQDLRISIDYALVLHDENRIKGV